MICCNISEGAKGLVEGLKVAFKIAQDRYDKMSDKEKGYEEALRDIEDMLFLKWYKPFTGFKGDPHIEDLMNACKQLKSKNFKED